MPAWVGYVVGTLIIGALMFLIIKSAIDIVKFVKINNARKKKEAEDAEEDPK